MEDVFKALADPARRELLDRLFVRDGQTLRQLTESMGMTRFGVMKHLGVLEAAHLVSTRREGREKLHFLNPVPIAEVYERWVGKYAAPWAHTLTGLKRQLEGTPMTELKHQFEIFIRTTPEALWAAITQPDFTRRYFHGTAVEGDFRKGSPLAYRSAEGHDVVVGEVLEADPPRRLVTTWQFAPRGDAEADPPSRVTWEIGPGGADGLCLLRVVHDGFATETETYRNVAGEGWMRVLSGLKTVLETGDPMAA